VMESHHGQTMDQAKDYAKQQRGCRHQHDSQLLSRFPVV